MVLALGSAVSRSSGDDFGSIGSRNAELFFLAYSKAGKPTEAGSSAFLGRGLLRIRNRPVWEAELLAVSVLADCIGLTMVMRCIAPSTL